MEAFQTEVKQTRFLHTISKLHVNSRTNISLQFLFAVTNHQEEGKAGNGYSLPIAATATQAHSAQGSPKPVIQGYKTTLKSLFRASTEAPTFAAALVFLADQDLAKAKALVEKLLSKDQTNVTLLGKTHLTFIYDYIC